MQQLGAAAGHGARRPHRLRHHRAAAGALALPMAFMWASVACCQPASTSSAARPAGSVAAIRAKVAPPVSQPATVNSVGTPPSGTLRVVRSGLHGSSAMALDGARLT